MPSTSAGSTRRLLALALAVVLADAVLLLAGTGLGWAVGGFPGLLCGLVVAAVVTVVLQRRVDRLPR